MTQNDATVTKLPLIFTYRDPVVGNGFLATVSVRGRALAHLEGEADVWIEGVQPGGFAGTGSSLQEAHSDFRHSFTAILIDIASTAEDFNAFEAEVQRFFAEENAVAFQEWLTAVDPTQAESLADRYDLQRVNADTTPYVLVQQKVQEQLTPQDNTAVDPEPAIAA